MIIHHLLEYKIKSQNRGNKTYNIQYCIQRKWSNNRKKVHQRWLLIKLGWITLDHSWRMGTLLPCALDNLKTQPLPSPLRV